MELRVNYSGSRAQGKAQPCRQGRHLLGIAAQAAALESVQVQGARHELIHAF